MPAAQFPDFAARFDAVAPDSLAGCSPPFLSALPEPGTLQIWTGLMARTAPNWSLLIRAPANLPSPGGYSMYEGIVETDRWFGPLFTNLRFTRTDVPVRLRADFPLAQVQPLPRMAYADATLGAADTTADMAGLVGARLGRLPGHDRHSQCQSRPQLWRICGRGTQACPGGLPVRGRGATD